MRCCFRRVTSVASQKRFLLSLHEKMVQGSTITKREGKVLGNLIRSQDKRLYSSAVLRPRGRKQPEEKEVQKEVREKVRDHLKSAWDAAFKNMPTSKARQIASARRDMHDTSTGDLTYGEITFNSFFKIFCEDLKTHGVKLEGTFYDLGSGTGRGVIAAALVGSFNRVCGIETVGPLHDAAVSVQKEYESHVIPDLKLSQHEVAFVHGNLLRADWSDADVIFINSTCFSVKLMENIAKQAVSLRPGACIVTLTRPIVSPYFDLLESKKYLMSWGDATAHIHIRTSKPQPHAERKARYWSNLKPGKTDYGALFDGYSSA
mmetsp:Transcript_24211/g.36297  ORF Transcript_24211/g.36297 Transcript_24211/m.36297 type:complete len:318 (-) Transcript_24211:97-1050(-)